MLVGDKAGWEVGGEVLGNTFTMSNTALCNPSNPPNPLNPLQLLVDALH